MRFKNLTITITLGCLSIVALAGLVMLPIEDVISCSDDDRVWNKAGDNRSASFSAYHKYPDALNNLGWSVSGSVRVSVAYAYASASPSIVDPDRIIGLWEADNNKKSHTFFGNATVKAAVYPANFDSNDRETYEDTPYPNTSLSANVQVKVQRYSVCLLESKSREFTKTHNFAISVAGEIPAGLVKIETSTGYIYEYTDEYGEVWTASIEDETTGMKHALGQVTDKTATKNGGSDWSAAYATVSSFNMDCGFPDGEVSLSKGECTLEELGITGYDGLY